MNSKSVLGRIAKLLSLSEEVTLTYAKLADGTIVESATFDVGEDLFVVSEDGTKTPAPDGYHDLMLKDEEGNENLIKVKSEGGKIVERENVELADVEDKKTEPLPGDPGTGYVDPSLEKEKTAGQEVKDLKPSSMLAEETVEVEPVAQDADKGDMVDEEAEEEGGDLVIALKKSLDKLAYRIEEMEKKFADMEKVKEEVVDKKADEEVELGEEELPKLDGAPVEEATKFSQLENKNRFGKKIDTPQSSFLSKLYK